MINLLYSKVLFGSATAGGSLSNNTMVSYFGRINYDYASKYIVSLNYRRDGYSALSEKNRWGNFGRCFPLHGAYPRKGSSTPCVM